MPVTFERRLPFTGAVNFRDLGGYAAVDGRTTAWGRLFRSDSLSALTEEDLEALGRLGLSTVCDLRKDHERVAFPNRLPTQFAPRTFCLGFSPRGSTEMWDAINRGELLEPDVLEEMRMHYRRLALEHAEDYGRFLKLLLEPGALPALVHCASGKDRTGFAVAIVLMALGVPRATIVEDYVISDLHRRDLSHLAHEGAHPAAVNAVAQAIPGYLEAAFETIDATWGGEEAYLARALGLSATQRERLRDLLLET
ncbi:MAG TPA: tyrosine-protein phosphatase [Nevskiaceae bacterium]|nr:tyrosine-protein phosphatase [Nevskiaceae bacterium]